MSMTADAVALVPADEADRAVVQAMVRFYVYHISEYTGLSCPPDGLYECLDLGRYWTAAGTHRFFIEVAGERAGFALIDRRGMLPETEASVNGAASPTTTSPTEKFA